MKEAASMDQAFLDKVHEAIENNLANEKFGVEELALEIGISRIHLHRKLKLLTGKTAGQTIKEARLKKAMELLQNNVATSAEISYQVGFGSPSYFNTCFREYFGYPPGKVKLKRSFIKIRKHAISRRYIFASIATILVVVLIFLNILPRLYKNELLEKSIAVLPIKYLGEDPNKQFLANAVLDAITGHLSLIEGLRVMPRTSVEQYRENIKSTKEIGEELDVSYLIEGSFLMIEDQVKLTIQLVAAKEGDHLLFKEYDINYEDIIAVQSQVAQTIAKAIEVAISPEEKQLIEKIPTTDLVAYEFYRRGFEEFWNYRNTTDTAKFDRAESLYLEALKYDSTFALAYTGLARIFWEKHYWKSYFSEEFLDSVLILTDEALYYDDQLSDAYSVRGDYYREKGKPEQAKKEYEKAIKLNPNDWSAYSGLGFTYRWYLEDQIKAIYNIQKALIRNRGKQLPQLLRSLGYTYLEVGFFDKAKKCFQEKLILDEDTIDYLTGLAWLEFSLGNFNNAVEIQKRAYNIDTSRLRTNNTLLLYYSLTDQVKEAYIYAEKYSKWIDENPILSLQQTYRSAYAYWQVGKEKEANALFNRQIKYDTEALALNRAITRIGITHYDLAAVYAFSGDKNKAYHHLREFNMIHTCPLWWITLIKNDPLFDSIRHEPEFQQIVRDVEAKYQAEHERVGQWLDENDML